MEVLFSFLNWVSSFSHVDEESGSKMDIHNLATVITPNILHLGKQDVPVDDSFLGIEAIHSLIEFNEGFCEIPEDLSLILNDSSLFSSSADITTKEILKRYGDRARVPSSTPAITQADPSSASSPRSREGKATLAPVATRVDTDQSQANAWQNESSVRHVREGGNDGFGTPQPPYALSRNDSTESHGSPNRGGNTGKYNGSGGGPGFEKSRAMGVT